MTQMNPAGPAGPVTPPPLPSITASALLESRLLLQAVATWLTRR